MSDRHVVHGMDSRPELKFAPRELFEKILEYCVIPTFDLIIELPEQAGILMVHRIIKPYENCWALPGLRMFKPEDIDDVLRRVAADEVGLEVDVAGKRLLGQFVGKFKSEHQRQDVSTGYVVRARHPEVRLNGDHFSSYRIIRKWEEVPEPVGTMYRHYLARYFEIAGRDLDNKRALSD